MSRTIIGPTAFRSAAVTGMAFVGESNDHLSETPAQIGATFGERENRHDLRRCGDDESGLTGRSVRRGRPCRSRCAAAPDRSCPSHAARESRCGSIPRSLPKCRCVSMRADNRLCAEVIAWKSPLKCRLILSSGASDALPPPVAPPFWPKTGPSDGSRRAATARRAALDQPLRQADGRDGLAFAAGRRRDRGDENQLSTANRKAIEQLEPDLGGESAVGLEQVGRNTERVSNIADGLHTRVILVAGDARRSGSIPSARLTRWPPQRPDRPRASTAPPSARPDRPSATCAPTQTPERWSDPRAPRRGAGS